jgi:hypothetical protein
VVPYNFPPWMCMDQSNYMLALLIPGKKSPGKDSSPWSFREGVLPIFLKICGDFTYPSAKKISHVYISLC